MANVVRNSHGAQITRANLDQILRSTFVEQVEFHEAIDSTNDRALELAHEPGVRAPSLVVAETQTDGRGRGTNLWWAQRGALTFSLLIETNAMRLPPRHWPTASLTAGLAVCEALEDVLDDPAIQLKWPNDVYLRQRKVCGILIEVPPQQKEAIVIGIGINVNNSARHAPEDLQSSAIALCDAAQCQFSLTQVLERVLVRLQERLGWIGHRDQELRHRWRERCLLTGRTVHLDSGTRNVVGLCHGIDDDGALVIETVNETERCFAGAVTQF
jgi:BirA family biotin operon repressor/biotin-[acetyl-CoA-carboxylase] ligase